MHALYFTHTCVYTHMHIHVEVVDIGCLPCLSSTLFTGTEFLTEARTSRIARRSIVSAYQGSVGTPGSPPYFPGFCLVAGELNSGPSVCLACTKPSPRTS